MLKIKKAERLIHSRFWGVSMLKKNKVIILQTNEDKEFWLTGQKKALEKTVPKPAPSAVLKTAQKQPVSTIKTKPVSKKKPLMGGLFQRFKLKSKKPEVKENVAIEAEIKQISRKLPEEININTVFDSIYSMLEMKKSVSVDELSGKLGLTRNRILELALIFEESGKIDIDYPLLGSPKLVLKEKGEMSE